jgi:hypothetical protein
VVLIVLSESASVAEPTASTILPKVDKVETSTAQPPMVPTLMARLSSKASDDTPFDDDPNLLNSVVAVS